MRDRRFDEWAKLLVHYSLEAKPGQYAVLDADPIAMPLIEACFEEFVRSGVHVETLLFPSHLSEFYMKHGSDSQLEFVPPLRKYARENCDLYLYIDATTNTKLLAGIDPKKHVLTSKARKPLMDGILNRAARGECRWALTHFPTPAAAQEAEMGTREYEEFVFQAGKFHLTDPIAAWKELQEKQSALVSFLETKKILHFQNFQGTDLKVNVEGMKWVNCCGKINFPDGEVYTGPNLNATGGGIEGVAKFALPTIYRGVEVHGIELTFEKGKVVDSNALKGKEFLKQMIAQDEGASRVGEIAIGTNWNLDRGTKSILFDEKLGGTFHLALGKGYPQTGNCNESALHWDMIFDLRPGGSIKADGEEIFKDGYFTLENWLQDSNP